VVRDHPDPPSKACQTTQWGISSAGRAPALQAGGRRFDPVILHQTILSNLGSTPKWLCLERDEAILMLIDIDRSIGCSLKIHRVESALLAETASWRTVPLTTIEFLIASKMNFIFESNR